MLSPRDGSKPISLLYFTAIFSSSSDFGEFRRVFSFFLNMTFYQEELTRYLVNDLLTEISTLRFKIDTYNRACYQTFTDELIGNFTDLSTENSDKLRFVQEEYNRRVPQLRRSNDPRLRQVVTPACLFCRGQAGARPCQHAPL